MQARLCDIIFNDNNLYHTEQLLIFFISLTKTKEKCVDCTNDLLLTYYYGEYFSDIKSYENLFALKTLIVPYF